MFLGHQNPSQTDVIHLSRVHDSINGHYWSMPSTFDVFGRF